MKAHGKMISYLVFTLSSKGFDGNQVVEETSDLEFKGLRIGLIGCYT